MSRHFTIGMAAAAALCFVLAGCGGGGDGVSQSTVDQLQTELDVAKTELEATKTELDTTQTELDTTQTDLEEETDAATEADKKRDQQIADLATSIAALTAALAAQEAETTTPADDPEDDQPAAPATTPTTPTTPTPTPQPPTRTTPTTQTPEASQRATNLKKAFPGGGLDADLPDITATPPPVKMTNRTKGNLNLDAGSRYRAGTLSGTGLRSTTLALTSGGDPGKIVVYSDRELTRKVLDHFGAGADEVSFDATRAGLTAGTTDVTMKPWTVTRPSDVDAAQTATSAGDLTDAGAAKEFIAGSYYGISGRYVCDGADCMITPTGSYSDPDTSTVPTTDNTERWSLSSLTLATTTGPVRFKPNSDAASISLCGGTAQCPTVDAEYMVFGYWREDPRSPAAGYRVGVFADAVEIAGNASQDAPGSATVKATYDGTAVGMYVEQDPTNPVDTHRQGEFTADVLLEVARGAAFETALRGTIDDFETKPTGGSAASRTASRWVVTLEADGDALISSLAGDRSGKWEKEFVKAHQHATDATPPAVTGTFNTRVKDFLHLLGAFGARR